MLNRYPEDFKVLNKCSEDTFLCSSEIEMILLQNHNFPKVEEKKEIIDKSFIFNWLKLLETFRKGKVKLVFMKLSDSSKQKKVSGKLSLDLSKNDFIEVAILLEQITDS